MPRHESQEVRLTARGRPSSGASWTHASSRSAAPAPVRSEAAPAGASPSGHSGVQLGPFVITALAVAALFAAPAAGQTPPAVTPSAQPPLNEEFVALQADRVVNDEKAGSITAEGAVEARYKGRTLRAGRLVYDFNTRRIRASGGVQITDPDGLVRSAEEMELDEEFNEGVATNLNGTTSDYVGMVGADFGPNFGARVRFRLDDENYSLTRLDASVRATVGALSGNVRYFNIDETLRPGDPSEEIRGDATLRLNKNWSVGVGLQRDLDSDISLSQNLRLLYED